MTRRLSLTRETLTELAPADLAAVTGGQALPGLTFLTCNVTCWTEV